MAGVDHFENLSIYKTTLDLVVKVNAAVHTFAKLHKYTLGGQFNQEALELLKLVAQAEGWRKSRPL